MSDYEIRKVGAVSSNPGSVFMILPKKYCTKLGIKEGEYVKIHVEGKTIVVEK